MTEDPIAMAIEDAPDYLKELVGESPDRRYDKAGDWTNFIGKVTFGYSPSRFTPGESNTFCGVCGETLRKDRNRFYDYCPNCEVQVYNYATSELLHCGCDS